MKKKNRDGFTLIEIIVVIMIIGILTTILVPTINHYVKKARIKAAIADTKVIKSAIETALIEHLTVGNTSKIDGFNKVLYFDKDRGKNFRERNHEIVGAFTNYSWNVYKTNARNTSKSQAVDRVIAGALDEAFTEKWETGKQINPMKYNSASNNCEKFLKDSNCNFGLVVVYNKTGTVRLIQIYRKGVLVTYIGGDYIVNSSSSAHFVGTGTWDTIYADSGESSPSEYCKINLSNQQIGDNGNLGGWY